MTMPDSSDPTLACFQGESYSDDQKCTAVRQLCGQIGRMW